MCACSDLISALHRQGQARERRKTRGLPRVPHRQRLTTPNNQRQTTLSQNPSVRLISPLPLQKPPERSPQWKLLAPNPHPSNLHPYLLHPSIMSDENYLFCAFMDVVTNSSTLRACSFRYKVHPRIIQNLLDEYHYHQLSRTRQEKEPLADTNNQNQIARWSQ